MAGHQENNGPCLASLLDYFLFAFTPLIYPSKLTKHSILSAIARFYGPLGLVFLVTTKAKIFCRIYENNELTGIKVCLHILQQHGVVFSLIFKTSRGDMSHVSVLTSATYRLTATADGLFAPQTKKALDFGRLKE